MNDIRDCFQQLREAIGKLELSDPPPVGSHELISRTLDLFEGYLLDARRVADSLERIALAQEQIAGEL